MRSADFAARLRSYLAVHDHDPGLTPEQFAAANNLRLGLGGDLVLVSFR